MRAVPERVSIVCITGYSPAFLANFWCNRVISFSTVGGSVGDKRGGRRAGFGRPRLKLTYVKELLDISFFASIDVCCDLRKSDSDFSAVLLKGLTLCFHVCGGMHAGLECLCTLYGAHLSIKGWQDGKVEKVYRTRFPRFQYVSLHLDCSIFSG